MMMIKQDPKLKKPNTTTNSTDLVRKTTFDFKIIFFLLFSYYKNKEEEDMNDKRKALQSYSIVLAVKGVHRRNKVLIGRSATYTFSMYSFSSLEGCTWRMLLHMPSMILISVNLEFTYKTTFKCCVANMHVYELTLDLLT